MPAPRPRPALLTLAVALVIPACERAPAPGPLPTRWAAPLKLAPLTFFQGHCANCHGAYGKDYDPDSPTNTDAPKLQQMLREMAAAHAAETPLDDYDLAVQKSFHLAAVARRPFLAITNHTWPEPVQITGEATPGSQVELISGPARASIPLHGHTFTIDAKALAQVRAEVTDQQWLRTEIVATKGSVQARITLASENFSASPDAPGH